MPPPSVIRDFDPSLDADNSTNSEANSNSDNRKTSYTQFLTGIDMLRERIRQLESKRNVAFEHHRKLSTLEFRAFDSYALQERASSVHDLHLCRIWNKSYCKGTMLEDLAALTWELENAISRTIVDLATVEAMTPATAPAIPLHYSCCHQHHHSQGSRE